MKGAYLIRISPGFHQFTLYCIQVKPLCAGVEINRTTTHKFKLTLGT